MMSRSSISPFSIINTWNKLTRYQHHHRFLSRCQRQNSIPTGLKVNFKLALGTNSEQLQRRCELHLQAASRNILTELIDYTQAATTELQHSLEDKRKCLFEQHSDQAASTCWNRAKKSITSLNRELNIRYRNKIKNTIPLHTAAPTDDYTRPKKTTRRYSKKVRKARRERFFNTLMQHRFNSIASQQQFYPINLSSRELDADQNSLLSKGPSFCPVPRDINRIKLLEDWEKFENRLRSAVFFHNDHDNNDSSADNSVPVFPTVKKTTRWKAPLSRIPELELFLESVKTELFNPDNVRFIPDNLSKGERQALSALRDIDSQTIKIQDKGSKFVIIDTDEYDAKMKEQLQNPIHYDKLDSDPSTDHVSVISQWGKKWLERGQISENIAKWVVNENAKPGKAFGTIKTHKEGNPLRLITSCCGTAIENLSAFTEFYLKPLAQNLPSFVKDTTHFLQKIEDLNKSGPFPKESILVSWDVVAMFPNIDNNLGINAITDALNSRANNFPSTDCIVEAVKICLQHNNSHFKDENFLQIHGTAMGPKNACSYADLAMGVIDKKAMSGTIKPNLWWRYRDDIFDLWTQGHSKLIDFTQFINSLYPTIKFTLVHSPTSLNVLDLTLNFVEGYIQTDIYSKPTDNHIYLLRNSAHPAHCSKAIPYGVATRVRRNCSTPESFEKRSVEYQSYLINRGYNHSQVKQQFDRVKSIPRENLLAPTTKESKKVFPLVLDYNPSLPSIGKIFNSYKHLIHNSPSLAKIFPKGSIIPSFRRTKNIKDILARPRRTNYNNTDVQGCFKCKGKCDLCRNFLVESDHFTSASTNRIYPITQHLHCKSKNVIYLVTCNKCNVQYIGSTSNEFKVRFRNHKSAMSTKKNTCEVAIHFNKETHVLSDFDFAIIEQVFNFSDNNSLDHRLLTREAYWSAQLCTLQPYGLNKRSEFNSKNRIRYN